MSIFDFFRPPPVIDQAIGAPLPQAESPPEFVPTDTTHHEIVIDDAPGGLFVWTARVYHHEGPVVEKVGAGTSHDDAVSRAGAWANKEMERAA